jgi:hypothetical protein
MPIDGGISSLEMQRSQYICLMAVPAAMERRMRGWRGKPRATSGPELAWAVEMWRRFRRGSASPLARMPYCTKTSRLRRPTKRDVPRGDGPLTRETRSTNLFLSDIILYGHCPGQYLIGSCLCTLALTWRWSSFKRGVWRRGYGSLVTVFGKS